jgi:hypothetical protein
MEEMLRPKCDEALNNSIKNNNKSNLIKNNNKMK